MPHVPETTKPEDWHRYLAVECNNRAWTLAVASRNKAEDAEMLNAAHAAALHWDVVGTELNHKRATMLLAEVHALLGLGSSALAYAEEVKIYFTGKETPDWELGFTYAIHAHAARAAGEEDVYRASYANAVAAIENIEGDEDRKVVLETFNQIPTP